MGHATALQVHQGNWRRSACLRLSRRFPVLSHLRMCIAVPRGLEGNTKSGAWMAMACTDSHCASPALQVRPSTQRGLGNWMHANVNKPPVPNWCACGMFWVSREHIYRNSRGFYKRLLDLMGDHPNPEDGECRGRC